MTATERLRALLDERGVKHTDIGGMTEWTNGNGRICRAYTRPEPLTVDVAMLAVPPQQAVEATLGRGECRIAYKNGSYGGSNDEVCSECGEPFYGVENLNYCPNCGRKVVDA